jgi:hypothetical protein
MDPILALALEGEREVAAGKWTVPKEASSTCDPMARCHFCEDFFWFRRWVDDTWLRPGKLIALCENCYTALRGDEPEDRRE